VHVIALPTGAVMTNNSIVTLQNVAWAAACNIASAVSLDSQPPVRQSFGLTAMRSTFTLEGCSARRSSL
jgi:hypothetical protein